MDEENDLEVVEGAQMAPAATSCLHDGLARPYLAPGASTAAGSTTAVVAVDLLVLILSSQQKRLNPSRRRMAVRRSWAHASLSSDLGARESAASDLCSVRYVFVLGGGKGPARMLRADVLELPVPDGYRQISAKVVGALRWAVGAAPFRYLLKTDDDSFVCVARLLELLRPLPRSKLYLGVINPKHNVITADTRTNYERWRDPDYVTFFNRSVYAPYMQVASNRGLAASCGRRSLRCSMHALTTPMSDFPCEKGAGYILSADLAATAVARADVLPRLTAVEDALVGALVEGDAASTLSRPHAFRHKNRDDYAVTVCEEDTEVSPRRASNPGLCLPPPAVPPF